jgi:hypothetical protein
MIANALSMRRTESGAVTADLPPSDRLFGDPVRMLAPPAPVGAAKSDS